MVSKRTADMLAMLSPHAHNIIHDALKQAVKNLFTSHLGEIADRLALMDGDGRDMGGWCQNSVVKQLSDTLGIHPE